MTRNYVVRLNSDGTIDPNFDPGVGPSWSVEALAVQPDGKVIIGGNFNQVSGVNRSSIARLNEDGSYDATFGTSPFAEKIFVRTIQLQPDGKVLVGGSFYANLTFPDSPTPLTRLLPDGSTDPSFVDPGLGKGFSVGALQQQPDGKILVGGGTNTVPNANVNQFLNRLNANGALDTSFKSGAIGSSNSALAALAMQGDGKVIVGGQFSTSPNSIIYNYLYRLEGDKFITWEAGDGADKTVSLPIVDDLIDESVETLGLTLTPLTGGASTGTYANATLTILDAPPTVTQLSMTGEQGDYIGGPNNYFYAGTDGNFNASAADNNKDGLVDSVNLSMTQFNISNGHWWYLDFNTHSVPGQNLVPGYYPDAQRAPFTSSGHPGLSISGNGRGCNTLTGNFTVHEAEFDYTGPTPTVIGFTASFEQHCEGGTAALVGTIYYRYTGSSPTYALTGKIVDTGGNAVPNVPINLGGSQTLTTNTDSAGNYSFANLIGDGNFIVRPAAVSTHIISPASQLIKRLNGTQTADFTAIPLYTISGKVTDNNGSAMSGVQVKLTGSKSVTVTTDNSGNYSFTDLRADGNYTVTPSRQYYEFAPQTQTFATLSGNQTLNFTGTRLFFTIGGRVINEFGIGISGITVNLSGERAATMQTDSMGNYSFANLPAGGNYTTTAIRANYSFSPPSQSIFGLNSNFSSVNFTGRLMNYNISGLVLDGGGNPISNATLTLSGSKTGSTATNLNGAYSFTVPAEGNYTVTPSKSYYTFVPVSRAFNNLSGNQPANFIGTLVPLQLILDESGSVPNQAAAMDATLFLRDPFPVVNPANVLIEGADKNTRVIVFVANLQLAQGEAPSSVVINLIDGNSQSYDVMAEDVRLVPLFNFTQVRFRLPDNLAPGVCTIKVKAHAQESNSGTIRIRN